MRQFTKLIGKENGFSLTSVLVAVGITAVLALGAATFLKNLGHSNLSYSEKIDRNNVMKLVELQFRGKNGCIPLLTKSPGNELEVQMQNEVFRKDAVFAGMVVKEFRFGRYIPINNDGSSGVAEVVITLLPKGESAFSSSFPVPVKVNPGPNTITGCDVGQSTQFQNLVDELCSKTYGSVSAGMSCAEVVATLKKLATVSICKDLYGNSSLAKIENGHCNLSGIHLGQSCSGTKAIRGFDNSGNVVCMDTE